jgi:hypothetical protein
MPGALMQLVSYGASDIYLHGNPQQSIVPYGVRAKQNSHSNPYCPTLEYSFIDGKKRINNYIVKDEHIDGTKEIYEKYWGLPYEDRWASIGIPDKDLQGHVDFDADDPREHIILPDFPKDKLMTHIVNEKNLPINKSTYYKDYEQDYKATNRDEILKECNIRFKGMPYPKKNGIKRDTIDIIEKNNIFASCVIPEYKFTTSWKKELDIFLQTFIISYYCQFIYKDTIIPVDKFPTDYNLVNIIQDLFGAKGYKIRKTDECYYFL